MQLNRLFLSPKHIDGLTVTDAVLGDSRVNWVPQLRAPSEAQRCTILEETEVLGERRNLIDPSVCGEIDMFRHV